MRNLILATRGGALALAQAEEVKSLIEGTGEAAVTVRTVTTKGDRDRTSDLVKIGGNGLFVRGVEEELLAGRADIAVHCGKDLPFEIAPQLVIAGVPRAASGLDCLVTKQRSMQDHPVIGTGSMRRIHELRKLYPEAEFRSVRGNILTRIRKLDEGYDGIVLAKAGLQRLGLLGENGNLHCRQQSGEGCSGSLRVRVFSPQECIPACTQGILAIECRKEDRDLVRLVHSVSDPDSEKRFRAERCLFTMLHADCTMPVGIWSELLPGNRIHMRALYSGKYAEGEESGEEYERLCEQLCFILSRTGQ